MVEGRVRKFYEEVTLLAQVFVIDGETKVGDVIKNAEKDVGAPIKVTKFVRYALGEGIDKGDATDFAAEVAATAGVPLKPAPSLPFPRREPSPTESPAGRQDSAPGSTSPKGDRWPSPPTSASCSRSRARCSPATSPSASSPNSSTPWPRRSPTPRRPASRSRSSSARGNIFRGMAVAAKGADRVTADIMGMLGTVINSLALGDAIEQQGVKVKVYTRR